MDVGPSSAEFMAQIPFPPLKLIHNLFPNGIAARDRSGNNSIQKLYQFPEVGVLDLVKGNMAIY
jgi:hypothetical protein